MKTLKFEIPEYHSGLNTTIRRGVKKSKEFKAGDQFVMVSPDGTLYDTPAFKVVFVRTGRFVSPYVGKSITNRDLSLHHLESVRSSLEPYIDALAELKKHYPGFDPSECVTVIGFSEI